VTSPCVLDASALLALCQDEEGASLVEQAILSGAAMSAVNLAEVLAKFSDKGEDPAAFSARLADRGLDLAALRILPFDGDSARETARIRRATTGAGLSLGDRACLALGKSLDAPVLTTDGAWARLRIGVRVRMIR
jgi:ribonuclease VapC